MNAKFFLLLIVALTLVASIGYYFRYYPFSKTDKTSIGLLLGQNAIYVQDQPPGQTITVIFASLEKDGFVVIHEGKNARVGAIIGKSNLLPRGEAENLSPIILSRKTSDAETLFAMLHRDNGDKTFNPKEDVPITDSEGEPFMMQFMIDKDAVELPGAVSL